MAEFYAAVLPSIALLIYVYKKDKKEKEPAKLLGKLFLGGTGAVIVSLILEELFSAIVDSITVEGSVMYAVLTGFIVAGFTEEWSKLMFLKHLTWKSRHYDCVFDGIVYSVFVSLGFATLENIFYVSDGGLLVAISRMITAIPGHACFAVIMGYYYSMSKVAFKNEDAVAYRKAKRNTLLMPMLGHGLYDALLMMDGGVASNFIVLAARLFWIAYVIMLFTDSFRLVSRASNRDEYILYSDEDTNVSFTEYADLAKKKKRKRTDKK